MGDGFELSEKRRAMISWAYPGERWLGVVSKVEPKRVDEMYNELLKAGKLNGIKDGVLFRRRDQKVDY